MGLKDANITAAWQTPIDRTGCVCGGGHIDVGALPAGLLQGGRGRRSGLSGSNRHADAVDRNS
jgi:hypothetical protein